MSVGHRDHVLLMSVQWSRGRALDSWSRCCGFDSHPVHCKQPNLLCAQVNSPSYSQQDRKWGYGVKA